MKAITSKAGLTSAVIEDVLSASTSAPGSSAEASAAMSVATIVADHVLQDDTNARAIRWAFRRKPFVK